MNIIRRIWRRWPEAVLTALLGCVAFSSGALNAQAGKRAASSGPPAKYPARTSTQETGERKFQENCSRCHTMPEQLSPRIAGTVVRHMRVRASLSAEDAKAILRYLSP